MDGTEFLETLFKNVEGWWQITALHPDNNSEVLSVSFKPEKLSRVLKWAALRNEAGYGVFMRICPSKAPILKGRGREDQSAFLPAFWAEIDSDKCGMDSAEILAMLSDFAMPPSLVVETGGGCHAYWLLEDPIAITEANIATLKHTIRGLTVKLGGDIASTDLARALRVPGFVNTKPQRNGFVVSVVSWWTPQRYSAGQFAIFEQFGKPPEARPYNGSNTNKKLPQWAMDALATPLKEGGGQFGGRNGTYHRIAWIRAAQGCSFVEIDAEVGSAARASGLDGREVETLIYSAIARAR